MAIFSAASPSRFGYACSAAPTCRKHSVFSQLETNISLLTVNPGATPTSAGPAIASERHAPPGTAKMTNIRSRHGRICWLPAPHPTCLQTSALQRALSVYLQSAIFTQSAICVASPALATVSSLVTLLQGYNAKHRVGLN